MMRPPPSIPADTGAAPKRMIVAPIRSDGIASIPLVHLISDLPRPTVGNATHGAGHRATLLAGRLPTGYPRSRASAAVPPRPRESSAHWCFGRIQQLAGAVDARGHTRRGSAGPTRAPATTKGGMPMTMRPDPTFHASPKLAMEAPPETFAYTLLLSPDFAKPDALAVIDVKRGSPTFSQIVHTVVDALQGRRVPPFRLERLLLGLVAARRPRLPRAALPDHPGYPVLADLCRRHQAGSHPGEDPQDHRARGALQEDRLLAAAHRPLRAGRHLRQHARRRRQGRHRRAARHLHHGLRDVRHPRPLGDRSRPAEAAL